MRARIEAAYLALTGGERAKAVRLSALREELADLDRETLDEGLAAILRGDATARLSQFSDPKSLDAAERAAAYAPAGEPFHILWIQS
jgi:surface antigen